MNDGDRVTREVFVDRWLVRGIGTLAVLGAFAFLIAGLHAIFIYLLLSGVVFWIFSLRWPRRYQNVLDEPPEGFRPTGEVYTNPGADEPVAVYFKGIRRVYVKKT